MCRNEGRHGEGVKVHGIEDKERSEEHSIFYGLGVDPFWLMMFSVLELPFKSTLSHPLKLSRCLFKNLAEWPYLFHITDSYPINQALIF
jgi:hypothetical protein